MKKLKRLLSIMLTMAMVLAMNATVFADPTPTPENATKSSYTINIKGKTPSHTYSAYQIFAGELTKTGEEPNVKLYLSNIKWGTGIKADKTEDLVAALKAIPNFGDTIKGNTAKDVAEAIKALENDSDTLKAISDVFGAVEKNADGTIKYTEDKKTINLYLNDSSKTDSVAGTATTDNKYPYTITVSDAGYYFIKDTGTIGETATATDFILEVVGDADVNTKDDVVELEKKILEGSDEVDNNTAGLGDNVTYQLKSKVPDYSAYSRYYFIMNDTLSAGLDFNNDIKVMATKKGATETTKLKRADSATDTTADYYVYEVTGTDAEGNEILTFLSSTETNTASKRNFKIAFRNIKELEIGTEIIATYSAKLNASAVVGGGTEGNPNTANLTYSNDPNFAGNGDPDDTDENPGIPDSTKKIPTGETPDRKVTTFTTKVEIFKVDGDNKALAGAQFALTGISKETVLENVTHYVQDPNGDFYLLKARDKNGDLQYTTQAPQTFATMEEITGTPKAGYVEAESGYKGKDAEILGGKTYRPYKEGDIGKVYIKIEPNTSEYASTTIKFKEETVQTKSYKERIIYQTTEVSGVDGKISFPDSLGNGEYTITEIQTPTGYNTALPIKVVVTGTIDDAGNCTWSTTGSDEGVRLTKDSNRYTVTIQNKRGSMLPSTGGIGTTIFYIVGGILVLGAAILLITKKRVSKEV